MYEREETYGLGGKSRISFTLCAVNILFLPFLLAAADLVFTRFMCTFIGLFATFVNTFLKAKQEASDWPSGCVSDNDKMTYIDNYATHEGIHLDASSIKRNPGLRTVVKLILNSLWGKYGQRNNLLQSKICNHRQLLTAIYNENLDIHSVITCPANDNSFEVFFASKQHDVIEAKNTNIYIAAFTTSYARLKLYGLLHILQQRVMYYDTDSVIYIDDHSSAAQQIKLGDYLGDLTDELDGHQIQEFVSTGPKSYAYTCLPFRDPRDGFLKRKTVCKFKGVRKTLLNTRLINLKSMLQCIEDPTKKIDAENLQFKLNRHGQVLTRPQPKTFRMVYTKRWISDDGTYQTFPFGY
jgi:hypothetical protein